MSISDADKNLRAIAVDLIREHAESFEFCGIYEDDDLGELPEETQRKLFDLVLTANITATWEDSE
jgi:hypothetical protein